jgi:hypothetical protein
MLEVATGGTELSGEGDLDSIVAKTFAESTSDEYKADAPHCVHANLFEL